MATILLSGKLLAVSVILTILAVRILTYFAEPLFTGRKG